MGQLSASGWWTECVGRRESEKASDSWRDVIEIQSRRVLHMAIQRVCISELSRQTEDSVPLVGYPQRYGKRGSTLTPSTNVVLHGDEKSTGALDILARLACGNSLDTAGKALVLPADKEALTCFQSPSFSDHPCVGSLPAHMLQPILLICGRW